MSLAPSACDNKYSCNPFCSTNCSLKTALLKIHPECLRWNRIGLLGFSSCPYSFKNPFALLSTNWRSFLICLSHKIKWELKREKENSRRGEESMARERVREWARRGDGEEEQTLLKLLPEERHTLTAHAFQTIAFNPLATNPSLLPLNILDFHIFIWYK